MVIFGGKKLSTMEVHLFRFPDAVSLAKCRIKFSMECLRLPEKSVDVVSK